MVDRGVWISGVGVGVGSRRLGVAEIGDAWGRGGRGRLAVADTDQDSLTLGWDAALAALDAAGLSPAEIGGLWWGTTRPPFAEGPSWVDLAATLRLGESTTGALSTGSAHAGMEALLSAVDAIVAGVVERALVVVSDALRPGLGSGTETSFGAGAGALVLQAAGDTGPGAARGAARIGRRVSRWAPVLDRYRGDLEHETREVYDGRLFREQIFLPALIGCVEATELDVSTTRWSLPDPDGRLGAGLARRLGATTVSSAAVRSELGDLGAAAALVGVVAALETAGPAAAVAFGGGRATAVEIEVVSEVPGARRAVETLAAEGAAVSYAEVLRNRDQLVANGERVEMAIPPGSAMFVRDNRSILGLLGARCTKCDTVSFPPGVHPSCVGCGGDHFDEVELSRRGAVQTFVVNQTMPAPFVAPLPLVCVDLDDGVRVMFQGVGSNGAAGADFRIGARVELVLRRYTVERGVPIYGWKVRQMEQVT